MSTIWKPSVTVAAVIEHQGRFLMVEEETADGLQINQPAGHLEPGESLIAACAREALEETAHAFTPRALLGAYLATSRSSFTGEPVTYLRFAFTGELGARQTGRALDAGIVRTLWLTPAELRAASARHRSPLVMQCVTDYLAGARYPLAVIHTHPSAVAP